MQIITRQRILCDPLYRWVVTFFRFRLQASSRLDFLLRTTWQLVYDEVVVWICWSDDCNKYHLIQRQLRNNAWPNAQRTLQTKTWGHVLYTLLIIVDAVSWWHFFVAKTFYGPVGPMNARLAMQERKQFVYLRATMAYVYYRHRLRCHLS